MEALNSIHSYLVDFSTSLRYARNDWKDRFVMSTLWRHPFLDMQLIDFSTSLRSARMTGEGFGLVAQEHTV
jgi:hypothetical protein